MIPVVESIATAARAIPYTPIAASSSPPTTKNETSMPAQITITGITVLSRPIARPDMRFVPAPVSDARATVFTGLKSTDV